MKKILLIFIAITLFFGCNPNYAQNKEVEQFVKKVIENYNSKNTEEFNKLIEKNEGLIIIKTLGANSIWSKVSKVCLDNNCVSEEGQTIGVPYQSLLLDYKTKNLNLNKIEFTDKSYFECENIEKNGVFVSGIDKFHTLTNSVTFFKENYTNIIGQEIDSAKKIELETDLVKFKKLEQKSRRVIVNSDAGTFIFYITEISGKWFITIIDFASIDCSV